MDHEEASKIPRLHYGLVASIVARDQAKKRVLLGGLGAMGAGEMWVDEDPAVATYENYEAADERKETP